MGRLLAILLLAGIILFVAWSARPVPKPSRHHATPLSQALESGFEKWRLQVEQAMLAKHDAKRRKKKRVPLAQPISPNPIRITLVGKRIYAGRGDKDVPAHTKPDTLADFKRFHMSRGDDGEHTTVAYFAKFESLSDKPIKAAVGKLALRNREGKPLWILRWHFPTEALGETPGTWIPGRSFYEYVADTQSNQKDPNYREILWTPESDVTLEWTPTFVCYGDEAQTMVGDSRAQIDGEGLPVKAIGNLFAWVVHLQYPNETPGVTVHTIDMSL
jgi:hypothetical protein